MHLNTKQKSWSNSPPLIHDFIVKQINELNDTSLKTTYNQDVSVVMILK